MSRRLTRRSGVTLLELMISLTILVLILGSMAAATLSAQDAFRTSIVRGELESAVRRTVDRITEDLRTAGRAGLTPAAAAPLGSSSLQYQRNAGWGGGAVVWGTPITLELVEAIEDPVDGFDDDGDGIVDERCVAWTRESGTLQETTTRLVCGVPRLADGEIANGIDDNDNGLVDEAGLSFELDGDTLIVRLTLEHAALGGLTFRRSAEGAVTLRN